MVKIRLRRIGKKGQPSYRVVVTDARSPRDGRFIENIGSYDPMREPSFVEIDGPRALEWIGKGAQPSQAVTRLMEIAGVWDAYQEANGKSAVSRPKAKSKPKTVKEAPAAATPAAAAAPVDDTVQAQA